MRSPLLALLAPLACGGVCLSACSGGVDADGCFASEDLTAERRVGVRVHNECDISATCVIEVAYRCGEVLGPILSATFTLQPSSDTEQWLDIPCADGYRFAVGWQCSDEGTPEVPDPSI